MTISRQNKKTDYDKLMQSQISKSGKGKKLLLHCCCAPCSSACLERLSGDFEITVLFYNPNIHDDEYLRRKNELLRFIRETGQADFLDCDHDENEFLQAIAGLEEEKEGGKRCLKCFELRLEKTARLADSLGFDFFATTLTVSPLKNAKAINEIGEKIQKNAKWLYTDFKKRDGYLRSIQLSKEYHLYRQDYCGCVFSRRNRQTVENHSKL